jgi:CubicO group peptidase (beta-lactamase class C family)
MTTVSVMQCVERGLLELDADVGDTCLPEFKDVQVLEKMEDDGNGGQKPVLRAPKGRVTLRWVVPHPFVVVLVGYTVPFGYQWNARS